MKKVRFFFRVLARSITDPAYYQEIAQARFSFSLKYLYFLLFLISLVWGLRFAVTLGSFVPKIPTFTAKVERFARSFYPEELELTIEEGVLTTNVEEPYFFGLPENLFGENHEVDEFRYLAVIDTAAGAEEIEDYKALVLLTDEHVSFVDDQGGYRIFPYSQLEEDVFVDLIRVLAPAENGIYQTFARKGEKGRFWRPVDENLRFTLTVEIDENEDEMIVKSHSLPEDVEEAEERFVNDFMIEVSASVANEKGRAEHKPGKSVELGPRQIVSGIFMEHEDSQNGKPQMKDKPEVWRETVFDLLEKRVAQRLLELADPRVDTARRVMGQHLRHLDDPAVELGIPEGTFIQNNEVWKIGVVHRGKGRTPTPTYSFTKLAS